MKYQSWAHDLYFRTRSLFPGSFSAHFISMDRYRSSAHFANFWLSLSLNRSKKNQWFALEKAR